MSGTSANYFPDFFNHPTQFGVYIPIDLADEDPPTLKVYIRLVFLAKSAGSNSIELPPRDKFSDLCNLSRDVIRRSLLKLNSLNWININNLNSPGKTIRRRITIRYDEPRLINERIVVEMIETAGRKQNALRSPGAYLPPPPALDLSPIRSLIDSISMRDLKGRRIADLSAVEINAATKNAPLSEIEIALRELSQFLPKNGSPIRSIYGVLSRMFIKPKSEIVGMLNPHRKSLKLSAAKIINRSIRREIESAAFYPADLAGMPASHIDYVCKILVSRSWIETGLIPIATLTDHEGIFERHPIETKVRLRDEFDLKQIKRGYWSTEFVKISTALKRRSAGESALPIGESIKSFLGHE